MKKVIVAGSACKLIDDPESFLKGSIFKIFNTDSNRSVLDLHRKEHTDLIITSLEMNDIPGDEICKRIRNDSSIRDVSIILICNKEGNGIDRCIRAKANRYLTEPVETSTFSNIVKDLLQVSVRQSYNVLTNVTVEGEGFRFVACKIVNISLSGVLLDTEHVLQQEHNLTFSFVLPGYKRISARGVITRTVEKEKGIGYQYGVKFTKLDLSDRSAIEDFIKRRNS